MADEFAVREFLLKNTEYPNLLYYLYVVYDSLDEIQFGEQLSEFVINTNHWSTVISSAVTRVSSISK